jgi:hypothetical protein
VSPVGPWWPRRMKQAPLLEGERTVIHCTWFATWLSDEGSRLRAVQNITELRSTSVVHVSAQAS